MHRIIPLILTLLIVQVVGVRIQPRIVGGVKTSIRSYPYQVSISADGNHICGGVIIRVRTILTAGHCVHRRRPSSITIRAGSDFRTSGGTVITAKSYRIHPRFNRKTLNFDLAMIYLEKPLPFNSQIKAIPINTRRLRSKRKAVATGWGTTSERGQLSNVLRSTQVNILSFRQCKRVYRSALGSSMFCAGRIGGGKDTCQGDSGGPLAMNGLLIGITSQGNGCGRRGWPGIYTKIAYTRRWINRFA